MLNLDDAVEVPSGGSPAVAARQRSAAAHARHRGDEAPAPVRAAGPPLDRAARGADRRRRSLIAVLLVLAVKAMSGEKKPELARQAPAVAATPARPGCAARRRPPPLPRRPPPLRPRPRRRPRRRPPPRRPPPEAAAAPAEPTKVAAAPPPAEAPAADKPDDDKAAPAEKPAPTKADADEKEDSSKAEPAAKAKRPQVPVTIKSDPEGSQRRDRQAHVRQDAADAQAASGKCVRVHVHEGRLHAAVTQVSLRRRGASDAARDAEEGSGAAAQGQPASSASGRARTTARAAEEELLHALSGVAQRAQRRQRRIGSADSASDILSSSAAMSCPSTFRNSRASTKLHSLPLADATTSRAARVVHSPATLKPPLGSSMFVAPAPDQPHLPG